MGAMGDPLFTVSFDTVFLLHFFWKEKEKIMELNKTPSGERKHISFFGCRNAGKSSLLNAVTGQQIAIVSDIRGTTTDPVYKALELQPAGPVMVVDTPGLDDEGILGEMRIKSALKVLRKTDLAVLVVDAAAGMREEDQKILENIKEKNIPFITVYNKIDLRGASVPEGEIGVSAVTGEGINELKNRIAGILNEVEEEKTIAGDLVNPGDLVVLVVPIDKAAPKGRLILPQQQTIRDLLDHGAIPVVTRDVELVETMEKLGNMVKLVITDSQVFQRVAEIVPKEIPLTSFSILFSRYKGELEKQLAAIGAVDRMQDGDRILIAEGCSHHRQCGDIGTEKIPALLRRLGDFEISFTSGQEFPEDVLEYRLIIHCGGCMLNEREMKARIEISDRQGIPVTNYGMFIAKMTGVLDRSMEPLRK